MAKTDCARRWMLAAASLAICGLAGAAENRYEDYLKTVYPLADGSFVVTFANSPAGCPNASNPKYFYVQVGSHGVTADGAKAMLATALTAITAGKKLAVVFDDASNYCDVNRMTLTS
jgi:hypothetical protein